MDSDGSRIFKHQDGERPGSMQPPRVDVSSAGVPPEASASSRAGDGRGTGQPRRVLLVTNMALLAEGLRGMFDAGQAFHVAGECHDADAALAAVANLEPDMVVLDADMPHARAFDLAARIKQRRPGAGIVLLTEASLLASSRQAAGATVDACIPKTAGFAELLSTLHRVAANNQETDSARAHPRGDGGSAPPAIAQRCSEFKAGESKLRHSVAESPGDVRASSTPNRPRSPGLRRP